MSTTTGAVDGVPVGDGVTVITEVVKTMLCEVIVAIIELVAPPIDVILAMMVGRFNIKRLTLLSLQQSPERFPLQHH